MKVFGDINRIGRGGAVRVSMHGTGIENSVIVMDSLFQSNSAQFGGGIDVAETETTYL